MLTATCTTVKFIVQIQMLFPFFFCSSPSIVVSEREEQLEEGSGESMLAINKLAAEV
jgi:hypothetical protein